MVIDCRWYSFVWYCYVFDPQGFDSVALELPHSTSRAICPRRLLWRAVEPSGTGLPSRLETSGAPSIIASRGLPRSGRDITSTSKQLWIGCS
jgi:hypothetical protein